MVSRSVALFDRIRGWPYCLSGGHGLVNFTHHAFTKTAGDGTRGACWHFGGSVHLAKVEVSTVDERLTRQLFTVTIQFRILVSLNSTSTALPKLNA